MPRLTSREKHICFMCQRPFAARFPLKDHLIKLSKDKKPRCPGLRDVVPNDVWTNQLIPYYQNDAPLPDLSSYILKSPGRPKKLFKDIKHRRSRKRRISSEGTVSLSVDEHLELLHRDGDNDMRWLVSEI